MNNDGGQPYQRDDDYNAEDGQRLGMRNCGASPPVTLLLSPSFQHASHEPSSFSTTSTEDEDLEKSRKMKKHQGRKTNSFAYRVRDHVRMGPKLSEIVKGKLKLGAKIIQKGGRENIFKEVFGEMDGEKLLKASQCYLSTTAGPIAGVLFISTQKVAFCSDRSITLPSPNGHLIRKPYKVVIPTNKIKEAKESENVEKPTQKYIQMVTDDNFEFWFMGFVRYEKALYNLRKALSFVQN
ncbi:GEM-like protein 7 [Cynara cardunculus var. scolymus]|uniref:GRAM-like protein n=1 Tax=Cynara cardunculus var. scolymus TaxID=59895 RepID=A0A103Y318_CYNCS|nr:GEM-like protein 7 [Cynara cardunculus var. scolymus]KVI01585.1 GRAM-like protein [Cynara cardunculus var. scolymus]